MFYLETGSQNSLFTARLHNGGPDSVAIGAYADGDSLHDIYKKAASLAGIDDSDFDFSEFSFQSDDYRAEWSIGLSGYIINFPDGNTAETQTYTDGARFHAGFGESYIERSPWVVNDELSEEQEDMIEDFISSVNIIKSRSVE